MGLEELKPKPIKENGERSNHDLHLRLSWKEKERLIMLTKAANHATMSSYVKSQLFKPDLHFKLDIILARLDKLGGITNEADRSRKISKQKS